MAETYVEIGQLRGPQGERGPRGDVGPHGPQGPVGPKGDRGVPGSFHSVGVTTIAADQPGYVEMTGDELYKHVQFYTPRGLPGVNAVANDTATATAVLAADSETHAAVATVIANTIPSTMAPPPNGVDDTSALLDVIASAPGAVVELHAGEYKISQPLPFSASIVGQGQRSTVIKCLPAFAGGMMIDFAGQPECNEISGLTLDATFLSGVQHFGSSSGNADGGSKGRFTDVRFIHSAPGVYSVGGSSTTPAPGMLTGSVFERCDWDSCAQWIWAGNNQDDVLFISCRGSFNVPAAKPNDYVIRLTGNNIRFIDSFFHIAGGTDYVTFGVRPFILVGGELVKFEQTFIEDQAGTSNFTHLFHAAGPRVAFDLEQTRINLVDTELSFRAVIRSQITSTQPNQSSIRVNGIEHDPQHPATFTLLDVYVPGSLAADKKLTLNVSNIDDIDTLVVFDPGSDAASAAPVVRLFGTWRGLPLVNSHVSPSAPSVAQAIQFWSPTNSRYFRADESGLFHTGRGAFGVNALIAGVNLAAYASDPTNKAIVARAAASQTANILEIQNSAGAVVASVDRIGNLSARQFRGPASTTANRPTDPVTGTSYFDTTINRPIWFNGTSWINADGVTV